MAGCLCPDGSGNISPETFRRYVESLENVLSSQLGQHRFRDFLESREFEDGVATLDFWMQCNDLLNSAPKNTRELKKKAQELVNFANYGDINFDLGELREFNKLVESENREQIMTGVTRAKNCAFRLLGDYYQTYCSFLLKQKGYVKDKR